MRVMDMMLAIPGLLFAIAIVAVLGPGLYQIMIAIGIVNIPIFARLLRGSILHLKTSDYALSARALGASGTRILVSHLMPNSLTPLIVAGNAGGGDRGHRCRRTGLPGPGSTDPRTAGMGNDAGRHASLPGARPHLAIFPGLAIVLSVLGINLLGDGLRESLDPRLRR